MGNGFEDEVGKKKKLLGRFDGGLLENNSAAGWRRGFKLMALVPDDGSLMGRCGRVTGERPTNPRGCAGFRFKG